MFADLKLEDLNFVKTSSGFGPAFNAPSFNDQFDGRFFKPYNKREKLTKLVEFSMMQTPTQQNQATINQNKNEKQQTNKQAAATAMNQANKESVEPMMTADDFGFETVAEKSKAKKDGRRQGPHGYQQNQQRAQQSKQKVIAQEDREYIKTNFTGPQQTKKRQQWAAQVARANHQGGNQGAHWQRRGLREPSFEVKTEWKVISEFSKQYFDKLPALKPVALANATSAGQVCAFDKAYERVRTDKTKKMPKFRGDTFKKQTLADPVMERLAGEGRAQIFATDIAAAALMTSSKANYSWDLQMRKHGDYIFIDSREDGNMLDWQTCGESSSLDQQPLDDDSINGVRQLMKEAARVHDSYLHNATCQKPSAGPTKPQVLEEEDPFMEDEDQIFTKMGYIYKLWKISKDLTICIRCSVHSFLPGTGQYMNMYPLLAWNEKRQGWMSDLDSMTAVCLTREIADNAAKFSRWTVMATLAGVQQMGFGFMSRADPQGKAHDLIGSFTVNTEQFTSQINLNIDNCWATLKDVVETLVKCSEDEGTFLYMKDPGPLTYRLIKMNTDEEEKDSDDEDEGL